MVIVVLGVVLFSPAVRTQPSGPLIFVDAPVRGSSISDLILIGWAIDPRASNGSGIDAVHVWAYPAGGAAPLFVGAAILGRPRADIGRAYGSQFTFSGFRLEALFLPAGEFRLVVYAHSAVSGTFDVNAVVDGIRVVRPTLQIVLDAPADGAVVPAGFATVIGWAVDGRAATGTGIDAVHIWAHPLDGSSPHFLGAAVLGEPRLDIQALYGSRFGLAGFRLKTNIPAGTFRIIASGHSSVTGTFAVSAAVGVTVNAPKPQLVIDAPGPNPEYVVSQYGWTRQTLFAGTIDIGGWAIDPRSATATGIDAVHIWAYPTDGAPPWFIGVAAYGGTRDDVAALFGDRFRPSGFHRTAVVPPGEFTLVAYGHSTATGNFDVVSTSRITATTVYRRTGPSAVLPAGSSCFGVDFGMACYVGGGAWEVTPGQATEPISRLQGVPLPEPPGDSCFGAHFASVGIPGVACHTGQGNWQLLIGAFCDYCGVLPGFPIWAFRYASGGPSVARPNSQCLIGDFNRDGPTDLACHTGANDSWQVAAGTPVAAAPRVPYQGWAMGTWPNGPNPANPTAQCLTGDFNGDSMSDMACYEGSAIWRVGLSTAVGWSTAAWANGPAPSTTVADRCFAGDFTGDGRADLACYTGSDGVWQMGASSGGGWVLSAWPNGPSPAAPIRRQCYATDFSGDHRENRLPRVDIVCYTGVNGLWEVALSTGSEWSMGTLPGPVPALPVGDQCIVHDYEYDWYGSDPKDELACYTGSGTDWIFMRVPDRLR